MRQWDKRVARLIAAGAVVAGGVGVSVAPSSAAPEARTSLICEAWNSPYSDVAFEGATPGTYVISIGNFINDTDQLVVHAGDTLSLGVRAPLGSTGRLEIRNADNDAVLAASDRVPSRISTRLTQDSHHAGHVMFVTLETTRPGPVMVDTGCVGPCRVPGAPTLQARVRGLGSVMRCQATSLGLIRPDIRQARFTPAAVTLAPREASASVPAPVRASVRASAVARPVKAPALVSPVRVLTPSGSSASASSAPEGAVAPDAVPAGEQSGGGSDTAVVAE